MAKSDKSIYLVGGRFRHVLYMRRVETSRESRPGTGSRSPMKLAGEIPGRPVLCEELPVP